MTAAGAVPALPFRKCRTVGLNVRRTQIRQSQVKQFDAADYINDADDTHYFLAAALEHGDLAHLIKALDTVSHALGVAKIAKDAGMTRDNLYKTLAEGSRPSFTTINSLLKVFEIDLLAAAAKTYKREKRQSLHSRAA